LHFGRPVRRHLRDRHAAHQAAALGSRTTLGAKRTSPAILRPCYACPHDDAVRRIGGDLRVVAGSISTWAISGLARDTPSAEAIKVFWHG
jgi:hypothetical protein